MANNDPVVKNRPPIVVVLGHVDHGKTSLISKIKKLDLTKKEAGGISQQIGAYQVAGITFIDTPGHVAFAKMRTRGAKVADLAILVVAADEGVKPQTRESFKYIQEAKIPYLVAINKIDLPNVNVDWVKANLAENNILVEGYGGEAVAVPVSAKTGRGLKQLLEMILLLAAMNPLEGGPNGELEGVVIESKLDPKRGQLATVLIRNGQLKEGDEVWVEAVKVKVKALFDEAGRRVKRALPSQPVQVLGFTQAPPVGARVCTSPTDIVKKKQPADESLKKEVTDSKLKIILKADTAGALEAILDSFPSEVRVIESGVGEISSSDVILAGTTGAWVLGFNVGLSGAVKKLAQTEKVKVKTYRIIYDLLDAVEKQVLEMLEPTINEEVLGKAEVIAEFTIKRERIAGCRVIKGRISRQDHFHLKRGTKILGDGRIKSLRIGKKDVEQVEKGDEFGMVLAGGLDFAVGDVLIFYSLPPQKNEAND